MTDKYPPPHCRQRLMKEGKAYPKSSCAACGPFSPEWKECNALLGNATITADDLLDWKRRALAAEALVGEFMAHKSPAVTVDSWKAADELYCAGYEDGRRPRVYDPRGKEQWQNIVDLIDGSCKTPIVFCEYCGGNDETPQDHCMDCAMPVPTQWVQIVVEMSDYIAHIVDSQGQNRDKYPSVMRRYKLDMGMVYQARAMIAAQAKSAKKSS